nr:ABC transporter permease [uncultured Oscillibacter sp.]
MNFEFRQKPIRFQTAFAAVLIGLMVGLVAVAVSGHDPVMVFSALLKGALGDPYAISSTLRWTAPLLISSTAAAVCFAGGMFNMGIDGQLYVGSLAGTVVGLYLSDLPGILLIPIMMAVSMICGAAWAAVPALIRVKLNSSEIVPALMMNYIGIYLTDYLVHYHFMDDSGLGLSLQTSELPRGAVFPKIIPSLQITPAILIGLLVVFLFWIIIKTSKAGYSAILSGLNPEFARYGGIDVDRTRVAVMLISGALAGLCGMVEILSIRWRYESGFAPSFGNDGLLAALLGNTTPLGALIGSFFMGALRAGSLAVERSTDVSRSLTVIIQTSIICFVSARMVSKYIGFEAAANYLSRFLKPLKKKGGDQ